MDSPGPSLDHGVQLVDVLLDRLLVLLLHHVQVVLALQVDVLQQLPQLQQLVVTLLVDLHLESRTRSCWCRPSQYVIWSPGLNYSTYQGSNPQIKYR